MRFWGYILAYFSIIIPIFLARASVLGGVWGGVLGRVLAKIAIFYPSPQRAQPWGYSLPEKPQGFNPPQSGGWGRNAGVILGSEYPQAGSRWGGGASPPPPKRRAHSTPNAYPSQKKLGLLSKNLREHTPKIAIFRLRPSGARKNTLNYHFTGNIRAKNST